MARYNDIPRITRANYCVAVSWQQLEQTLKHYGEGVLRGYTMDPDYQRAHVWTEEQQIRYVEYVLRDGPYARDVHWNCPGWMHTFQGPLELVDGKQRLQAVRRFLAGEIPAFGSLACEYEDPLSTSSAYFIFNVNDLPTRADVLRWYLDINAGGTPHGEDEIARVRALLEAEILRGGA